MRTALIVLAVVLLLLAVPALFRLDAKLRAGRRSAAALEGGRAVLAIAAASALITVLARTR